MLCGSIHQIEQTSLFMEIGSIIDHVFNQRTVKLLGRRRLCKPVILDTLKFVFTVPGELTETTDGITLGNPKFKPVLLADIPIAWYFPDKDAMADQASKPLLVHPISSVELDRSGTTPGTSFLFTTQPQS